tara:strand:- start:643 stop:1596 length:954 start_codon:yes stop_codon:yes gene_type:complete
MIIKNYRAFICGIKGKYLSKNEIFFLKKYKPWGIILFSRNINSFDQTKSLIKSIKKIFKNKNYPIIIDEEGGRVSRLKKFIDNSIFSAKFFGDLYKKNNFKFNVYFNVYVKQITYLLKSLGININSVPVLDLRRFNSNDIIGDRSFSTDKKIISKIGDISIKKFHANKIATIMKHIPGHGLTKVDSHKKLPIIDKKLNYLINNDFYTFKNKKSLLAMTGHLLFSSIDKNNNTTHSKKMINIIRKKIGFKNIIITDDLSMKALKNSLKKNVKDSFIAGCNLVLHCNGNLKEMIIVGKNSPKIDNFIIKKTSQLNRIIS